MNDVDLPDLKWKLWTQMREDLARHVPYFSDNEQLLCPVCCRSLDYADFSLEHILPQQLVSRDPPAARIAIEKNERSGLTLLCRKDLLVGDRRYPNGCNGWKGRNFDGVIRKLLTKGVLEAGPGDISIVSVLMVGYLGLFRRYGYRVALTQHGLILRNQFFNPRRFTKQLPLRSQMVLTGDPVRHYDTSTHKYWSEPVSVHVDGASATVVVRNCVVTLTLSYDPTVPIARSLPYAPRKHVFRPDLRLAFV